MQPTTTSKTLGYNRSANSTHRRVATDYDQANYSMQSEGPISRVGWHSEVYVDYDRNKTGMAASESLTTNKNYQEMTVRGLKEQIMECRDLTDKHKKDMAKVEDNWNKTMEMVVGGIELRMRELTNKLKVQCTFADKEHKQLHKEGDSLIEEFTELSNNTANTEIRMLNLEAFVGTSAHQITENAVEESKRLEPVEEQD